MSESELNSTRNLTLANGKIIVEVGQYEPRGANTLRIHKCTQEEFYAGAVQFSFMDSEDDYEIVGEAWYDDRNNVWTQCKRGTIPEGWQQPTYEEFLAAVENNRRENLRRERSDRKAA